MTKNELLEKLASIGAKVKNEKEEDHFEADLLLIEYINDPDIKRAYDKIPKWYS